MLYIVGGVSRSGKTALSLEMMRKRQIPYFPIDFLRSGFHWAMPETGICHDSDNISDVSEKMWPFLYAVLRSFADEKIDYLVEGDSLLPRKVAKLERDLPNRVRACFLGYPNANLDTKFEQVRAYKSEINNWPESESDAGLKSYL